MSGHTHTCTRTQYSGYIKLTNISMTSHTYLIVVRIFKIYSFHSCETHVIIHDGNPAVQTDLRSVYFLPTAKGRSVPCVH